jgi:hypothetical protein
MQGIEKYFLTYLKPLKGTSMYCILLINIPVQVKKKNHPLTLNIDWNYINWLTNLNTDEVCTTLDNYSPVFNIK